MIAAELTREQIVNRLYQELPYETAIETETWEDRPDGSTVIRQQILVERDSQKAIMIGKGGRRLKEIGAAARERDRTAPRPAGALVPARQSQSALGRGPRPLPRHRARVGGLGARSTFPRPTPAPSSPALPVRLSSNMKLPRLGSRLISSVLAPQ